MKPRPRLEKEDERDLGKYARGKGCLYYKFTSPAHPCVPDRIVVSPRGRVLFLELKRRGNTPTVKQLAELLALTEKGVDARWSDNLDEMKGWIDEICA